MRRAGWFFLWLVLGGCIALGVVSAALGPLVFVPAAAVAAAVAIRWPESRRSLWGLVSGAGIVLLVVAYLNRQGPGTTCWHTTTASGCDQHLNPLPWLVVGILLVVAGLVAELRSH